MAINPVAQTDAVKVASQAVLTKANQTQSEAKEPTPTKTQPAVKDTVQISAAAEESAKTAAQKAGRADQIAKEDAAKAAQQGNKPSSILQPK